MRAPRREAGGGVARRQSVPESAGRSAPAPGAQLAPLSPPSKTLAADVEVFRRLYEEVGLGWVYAATKVKAVENLANK